MRFGYLLHTPHRSCGRSDIGIHVASFFAVRKHGAEMLLSPLILQAEWGSLFITFNWIKLGLSTFASIHWTERARGVGVAGSSE